MNDELHVLITVEDSENRAQMKLQRAIDEVKKLLIVVSIHATRRLTQPDAIEWHYYLDADNTRRFTLSETLKYQTLPDAFKIHDAIRKVKLTDT